MPLFEDTRSTWPPFGLMSFLGSGQEPIKQNLLLFLGTIKSWPPIRLMSFLCSRRPSNIIALIGLTSQAAVEIKLQSEAID